MLVGTEDNPWNKKYTRWELYSEPQIVSVKRSSSFRGCTTWTWSAGSGSFLCRLMPVDPWSFGFLIHRVRIIIVIMIIAIAMPTALTSLGCYEAPRGWCTWRCFVKVEVPTPCSHCDWYWLHVNGCMPSHPSGKPFPRPAIRRSFVSILRGPLQHGSLVLHRVRNDPFGVTSLNGLMNALILRSKHKGKQICLNWGFLPNAQRIL